MLVAGEDTDEHLSAWRRAAPAPAAHQPSESERGTGTHAGSTVNGRGMRGAGESRGGEGVRACLVPMAYVLFSFVFDKNCPIMDYLGLKDLSYDFLVNCVISFFFVYI